MLVQMQNDLEEELLMHIAAGTDLPTAPSALPRDEAVRDEQCSPATTKPTRILVWSRIILALIVVWAMAR